MIRTLGQLLEDKLPSGMKFIKRASEDQVVHVDVNKFDKHFQQDKEFYVGPGGSGAAIGDRYKRFGEWVNTGNNRRNIGMPEVHIEDSGRAVFINGRHRYAWLRDRGAKKLPMAMSPEAHANAHKHGLVAK